MLVGSFTTTWPPSGQPDPAGWNVSELTAPSVQVPGTGGSNVGRTRPSTSETGCEKVSWIGVDGSITVPGAGLTSASSRAPGGGNQLTPTGAESCSQGRAAAATVSVPKRLRAGRLEARVEAGARFREDELLLAVARQLEAQVARAAAEAEHDRGAVLQVEEGRAHVGARRHERRLDLLRAADEPRDPRRALDRGAHAHPLARRQLALGPDLSRPQAHGNAVPVRIDNRDALDALSERRRRHGRERPLVGCHRAGGPGEPHGQQAAPDHEHDRDQRDRGGLAGRSAAAPRRRVARIGRHRAFKRASNVRCRGKNRADELAPTLCSSEGGRHRARSRGRADENRRARARRPACFPPSSCGARSPRSGSAPTSTGSRPRASSRRASTCASATSPGRCAAASSPTSSRRSRRRSQGIAFQKIDLRDGATLERDRPYLVPLIEELAPARRRPRARRTRRARPAGSTSSPA